jgi:hypothetical protein
LYVLRVVELGFGGHHELDKVGTCILI